MASQTNNNFLRLSIHRNEEARHEANDSNVHETAAIIEASLATPPAPERQARGRIGEVGPVACLLSTRDVGAPPSALYRGCLQRSSVRPERFGLTGRRPGRPSARPQGRQAGDTAPPFRGCRRRGAA